MDRIFRKKVNWFLVMYTNSICFKYLTKLIKISNQSFCLFAILFWFMFLLLTFLVTYFHSEQKFLEILVKQLLNGVHMKIVKRTFINYGHITLNLINNILRTLWKTILKFHLNLSHFKMLCKINCVCIEVRVCVPMCEWGWV